MGAGVAEWLFATTEESTLPYNVWKMENLDQKVPIRFWNINEFYKYSWSAQYIELDQVDELTRIGFLQILVEFVSKSN